MCLLAASFGAPAALETIETGTLEPCSNQGTQTVKPLQELQRNTVVTVSVHRHGHVPGRGRLRPTAPSHRVIVP